MRRGELCAAAGTAPDVADVSDGVGRPPSPVLPSDLPDGWDSIPGARGCTAEACDFRDHHADPRRRLGRALALPTVEVEGSALYRRLTLIVRDHVVEHVFHPVFPPDRHAGEVLAWLRRHPSAA